MAENKSEAVTRNDDEDFLSRWSRRKHAQQVIGNGEKEAEDHPLTLEEQEKLPSDEDMPALETLTEDSDYTGFLSPNVSEELRSLALRKLFHSAAFNVCDGLDDYAEDFTSFAKLGDIITADMKHQLEEARKRLEQCLPSADEEALELAEDPDALPVADNSIEEHLEDADAEPVEDEDS